MNPPSSTYRLQLTRQFNFSDLDQQIGYLEKLGVDTLYLSPIFKAVPGSLHGYDVVDPTVINPELGNLKQLTILRKKIQKAGLKWLQDIVPNHMAFHPNNSWLQHVLEHGPSSPFYRHFDTPLSSAYLQGKLMVPVLARPLKELIETGEIELKTGKGSLYLTYSGIHLPVSPQTWLLLLDQVREQLDAESPEAERLEQYREQLQLLLSDGYDQSAWEQWREEVARWSRNPEYRTVLTRVLRDINSSPDLLSAMLEVQNYELCPWSETDRRINYRRFFTISSLICVNTQDEAVFRDTHKLIKSLLKRSVIDGLRVDHIDGLYNPAQYLRNLRKLSGSDTYIVVEKILEAKESLPSDWDIQGTTGYDFLSLSNNVLSDHNGKLPLTRYYRAAIDPEHSLKQMQIDKKSLILQDYMAGELDNLTRYFLDLRLLPEGRSYEVSNIRNAIASFLIYFPVYRLYDEMFPLREASFRTVTSVWRNILYSGYEDPRTIGRMRWVFRHAQYGTDSDYQERAASFFLRCMQLTGPLMAKGVEDTLMYTYHRQICHNEVGDHPGNFGMKVQDFHEAMKKRAQCWPLSQNATATHDTKRGEDARARLQVISASPDRWLEFVEKTLALLEEYPHELPERNDVYFLLQTIACTHPMPDTEDRTYLDRLKAYLQKYLREGKVNSRWETVNERYEERFSELAEWLLNGNEAFTAFFTPYLHFIARFGIINSLAQTTLKFIAPGIPDIYQGTELWDFSFVDPDNRRPVDFARRNQLLDEIKDLQSEGIGELWDNRYDARIKLWLLYKLLALRKSAADLFRDGDYTPLEVRGSYSRHILAFKRHHRGENIVMIAPLYLAGMEGMNPDRIADFDWKDTRVRIDSDPGTKWHNLLISREGQGREIPVKDAFSILPVAILAFYMSEPTN